MARALSLGVAPALSLGVALAAYAVLAVGYVLETPIWQNPDEPAHYNYVAQVAETGTLPELRPGDWDSALLERLKNGQLTATDSVARVRYEGWQPPLYYLVAAPVYRMGPGDDAAAAVVRLRLLNVGLGALLLVVAYALAWQVVPPWLALAVPLVLVGVPMFTAVSASVSADPLANLTAAGLVLVLAGWLRSGGGWRRALVAGLVLGLGLLSKLAVGVFVPVALAVAVWRGARPWREGLIVLGTAGVLVAPWLVRQVATYGWTDPLATARHAAVVSDQPRFSGLSVEYVAEFLRTSFHSFWAQFGWMALPAPDRVYWVWGVLSLWAAAGLVARRSWLRSPVGLLMLGSVLVAVVGYVVYNLAFEQFQGRYVFPALVPIGVLLMVGWTAWLPRSARLQALVAFAIAVVLVALNAFALANVVVPGFRVIGQGTSQV